MCDQETKSVLSSQGVNAFFFVIKAGLNIGVSETQSKKAENHPSVGGQMGSEAAGDVRHH